MTTTMTVPAGVHVPIRREGARPGSLHAALPAGDSWRTACGETLHDSPRGRMVRVPLIEAWDLIDSRSPSLCRRCDRAGDTVAS